MKRITAIEVGAAADHKAFSQGGEIKVGVSACLMGEKVRYNGGHSQSRLCISTLGQFFTFEPFCPEVAAGFGTPRPTMRLIGDPNQPTLSLSDNPSTDLTAQLQQGFNERLKALTLLDGYILMKNSPSCGLERVKVYQANGYPHEQKGRGLFAEALKQRYPLLPIEEEGRLHDPRLYENFVLRVYAHHNFRTEVMQSPSLHKLIQFHSRYKYTVMAHSPRYYKALGAMLAKGKQYPLDQLVRDYFSGFMQALEKPATVRNHTNTLLHILGHLKCSISSQARQQIADIIYRYRRGELTLITPLTLLKHYIDQIGSRYIQQQRYLEPYPAILGLANRI